MEIVNMRKKVFVYLLACVLSFSGVLPAHNVEAETSSQELIDLKKTVEDKKNELNVAQENLDAVTKKYNEGLVGFVNWMYEKDDLTNQQKYDLNSAKYILTKAMEEDFLNWYGGENAYFAFYGDRNGKVAAINDEKDALNLENVKKSFIVMKDINLLRVNDDNYVGDMKCKEAVTNFCFIATSACGADRGAGLRRHASLSTACENLAFGYTNPNVGWYKSEKAVFNSIKNHLGIDVIDSTDALNQVNTEAKNQDMTIAHYTNLMWSPETIMGVGYTGYNSTFCYNASKSSNYEKNYALYTIDEFETVFNEYYETVDKQPYQDKVDVAQQAFDKATKDYQEKCNHQWNEGEKTNITDDGCYLFTCTECGLTKVEHKMVKSEIIDPTCTEQGYTIYRCEGCDLEEQKEYKDATGHRHTEVRNIKDVSCVVDGYTGDTYCTDCNEQLEKGTTIKSTGHEYKKEITKVPTHKEDGVATYTCSCCNDSYTKVIPKLEHVWNLGVIIKKPTCKEQGEKTYTCLGCGDTKVEYIAPTGHVLTEIRNKKDSTCTELGYTGDTYCSDCDELIKEGTEIKENGHSYNEGEITKEPTCTEQGEKIYTCSECGETKTEILDVHGHNFGVWNNVTSATVFVPATHSHTCSYCGKTETKFYGSKLNPKMTVNTPSVSLYHKRTSYRLRVSNLAKGDSVKLYSTSNSKVAMVSKYGTIVGKNQGSAKITITLKSGYKKTVYVKVTSSIRNVPSKKTIKRKKSYTLKPKIYPSNLKATYKTSNKKIATVSSKGKIVGKKKGKAKITVTVGSRKAYCTVTVK